MQRTLALTGVALILAVTAGLAVAMDKVTRRQTLGGLWSGAARRARALASRPQPSPERTSDTATW